MSLRQNRNSFTLIELLIVVAIIGILAGVGIPMYNGYMTNAKINATTENHNSIRNEITGYLVKCATGARTIKVLSQQNKYISSLCKNLKNQGLQWVLLLNRHFYMSGEWINPYDRRVFLDRGHGKTTPPLGGSYLWYNGNYLTMITNIGDEDGNNKYITDSIFME